LYASLEAYAATTIRVYQDPAYSSGALGYDVYLVAA